MMGPTFALFSGPFVGPLSGAEIDADPVIGEANTLLVAVIPELPIAGVLAASDGVSLGGSRVIGALVGPENCVGMDGTLATE